MSETTTADDAVRKAIVDWVAERNEEDVIVIRYAVVAEVINADGTGEEWLKTFVSPDMSAWVHVGLAQAQVEVARERLRCGFVGNEEEDE